MRPPILYISGPYSAGHGRTVAMNIAVARAHAVAARKRGWMPVAPHLNPAHFEEDCPDVDHAEWLAGDLAILDLLDPTIDAVLMLPGWTESIGARQEFARAMEREIEIFNSATTPEHIPPAGDRGLCSHYRRIHNWSDSRDTCGTPGAKCPAGKTCPIRRRCR